MSLQHATVNPQPLANTTVTREATPENHTLSTLDNSQHVHKQKLNIIHKVCILNDVLP